MKYKYFNTVMGANSSSDRTTTTASSGAAPEGFGVRVRNDSIIHAPSLFLHVSGFPKSHRRAMCHSQITPALLQTTVATCGHTQTNQGDTVQLHKTASGEAVLQAFQQGVEYATGELMQQQESGRTHLVESSSSMHETEDTGTLCYSLATP